MVMSVATARLNDATREHPTSEHQRDHRDDFDAHKFLSSIAMLEAIRRRIPALLPPLMFLPTPMLRPALTLQLTLTRLPTMFPAARTAPVAIPICLLNGKRLPDRWDCQGMSRRRSHRSDCQQAKNCKASHDVAHRFTSSEQDGRAMRQMLVNDAAELRCLQRYRCRELCTSAIKTLPIMTSDTDADT
jgi:hypothetical protein